MRRFAAALCMAILIVVPGAARAAQPTRNATGQSFVFGPTSWGAGDIVEQQSPTYFYANHDTSACIQNGADVCVHNPTHGTASPCPWTEDDEWQNAAYGTLAEGTTQGLQCLIADNTNLMPATSITGWHLMGYKVVSDSPELRVWLRYDPFGVTFTLTPRLVSGRFEYRGCVVGPVPVSVAPIDGSNGGWGVPTTIAYGVDNQSGRKQSKVSAQIILWDDAPGLPNSNLCQTIGPWFRQGDASWQTGL